MSDGSSSSASSAATTSAPFAERRARVLEAMGPGVMLLPAAAVFPRNNDVEHPFRQDSDLFYLTGFEEPESILLLTNQHAEERAVLFLRERDPERETWDGRRLGVEAAPAALGVDAAYPIDEFLEHAPQYLMGVPRVHVRLGDGHPFEEDFFVLLGELRARARRGPAAPSELVDPTVVLHQLRREKDAWEVDAMERALQLTREGHLRAMALAGPGRFEYELEAELTHAFVRGGSRRVAYESIVGSGPNACILHYRENDRQMQDGELVLIDAGCELDHMASDITRTFPVSGTFSEPQRQLYELVLRAQEASIAAVKPGNTMDDVHEASVRVLTEGMVEFGLLQGEVERLIEERAYAAFYMHKTSHFLGMDVHDVGRYHEAGAPVPLAPGMVITIEPGIYVAPDATVEGVAVDERWRGIGIRIEDDVLVTADGHRNLSADIPKTVAEVEAACRAES